MATSREGKVKRVSFEAAKGGVMSETVKEYKRGGQGGGPLEDHEYEKTIHPTMEHAKAHLEASMGHCYGSEPKEAPKEAAAEEE